MTSADIVKWRKTNDYENFEKGMIDMKILKKGGSREKGGGGGEEEAFHVFFYLFSYHFNTFVNAKYIYMTSKSVEKK